MARKKAGKATSAKRSGKGKATTVSATTTTGSASRDGENRRARATSGPWINTAVTNRQRTRARMAAGGNVSPVLHVEWGAHPDATARQASARGPITAGARGTGARGRGRGGRGGRGGARGASTAQATLPPLAGAGAHTASSVRAATQSTRSIAPPPATTAARTVPSQQGPSQAPPIRGRNHQNAIIPNGSTVDGSFNPDGGLDYLPSATPSPKRPLPAFDRPEDTPSKRQRSNITDDPCKDFADGLAMWAAQQGKPVDTPMKTFGTNEMDVIYRAIATVTRAVSQKTLGDRQFCLITAADAAESEVQVIGPSQAFERPGQQAIIPCFKRDSAGDPITHVSLYIIERSPARGDRRGDDAFQKGEGSETPFAPDPKVDTIVDTILQRLGWPDRSSVKTSVLEQYPSLQAKDSGDTPPDAGHLAVLYAWMYVLGFPLENYDIAGDRHDDFHEHSMQVINLALQGNMDSKTIEAFLKCYGLVKQDQVMPSGRHFSNTADFSQSTMLPLLLAQTRLRGELMAREGISPSWDDVERALRGADRLSDIRYMNLDELLKVYNTLTFTVPDARESVSQSEASETWETGPEDTSEE